jgi:hypothetical protein
MILNNNNYYSGLFKSYLLKEGYNNLLWETGKNNCGLFRSGFFPPGLENHVL